MAQKKKPPVTETAEAKYRAPALEKGLDILEMLALAGAPVTLSQISVALDRSISELFRMVQVLEARGYIAASPGGDGFVLTNRLFTLGITQSPTRNVLEMALPVMRRLSDSIVQSCHLTVASNDQIVAIARIESPGDLGFSVRVGYRRAIVAATSGSVLFACQSDAVQAEWLARLKADSSARAIKALKARAAIIREQGYLRADSDFVQGVTDLSAPIMGPRGAIAALNVPYVSRVPPERSIDEVIPRLRAAAAEISAALEHDMTI